MSTIQPTPEPRGLLRRLVFGSLSAPGILISTIFGALQFVDFAGAVVELAGRIAGAAA